MNPYERTRVARAFSKTCEFWSAHQVLSVIVPGITGVALPVLVKAIGTGLGSLVSLNTAALALFSGIAACAVSWSLSFAANYTWFSPAALHREQQSQIEGLHRQVSDAEAAASVTLHEQERRRLVSGKMADLTPEEGKVIEALLRHGEIHRRDVSILGYSVDLFYRAVDKAKRTALVKEREDRRPGGVEQYLSINPAFELALQHYFARR